MSVHDHLEAAVVGFIAFLILSLIVAMNSGLADSRENSSYFQFRQAWSDFFLMGWFERIGQNQTVMRIQKIIGVALIFAALGYSLWHLGAAAYLGFFN